MITAPDPDQRHDHGQGRRGRGTAGGGPPTRGGGGGGGAVRRTGHLDRVGRVARRESTSSLHRSGPSTHRARAARRAGAQLALVVEPRGAGPVRVGGSRRVGGGEPGSRSPA